MFHYNIIVDSLYYAKPSLTWVFSRRFSVLCAPLSILDGSGRSGCFGVHFPLLKSWNGRDVSVDGMCHWVKKCVFLKWNFFRHAEQQFCGYWISLTHNARSGKVSSSHCYLDRRLLHEIDEIVYEYDRKQFHPLLYVAISRVIFNTLFNIIRVYRSWYVL